MSIILLLLNEHGNLPILFQNLSLHNINNPIGKLLKKKKTLQVLFQRNDLNFKRVQILAGFNLCCKNGLKWLHSAPDIRSHL